MATVTSVAISRSDAAICAALAKHGSLAELERFEGEMHVALSLAGPHTADVDAVLGRWHALATMAANPLTDDEEAQVARAKVADLAGLRARDAHGNWITL